MKRIASACVVLCLLIYCIWASIYNMHQTIEADDFEKVKEDTIIEPSIDNWKQLHTKVKGIYVTGPTAGTDRMDEIIKLVNDTELNAIVLDVKDDSGNITFMMDNEMVKETGACIPYIKDIDSLIKKLHDNEIYVIARIPCFKDPVLASAFPDLALRTLSGDPVTDANGNAWVNPCKEKVWAYLISIADTCSKLGFDEIQLDYVRFPVGQNSEEAYYSVSATDAERQNYINNFLSKIKDVVHANNVPITADVFGTIIQSDLDSKHIGQSYTTLASELDGLCPMIYPSHYANGEFDIEVPDAMPYATIYSALNGSKEVLSNISSDDCSVIRPWLQAFTADWVDGYIDYDGDAIREEIQAVYDAGYEEWILWNSKSEYSKDGLLSQ